MNVGEFLHEEKEVFQEIVVMLGGEENAECRTCKDWQWLCFRPDEFVCACHSSTQDNSNLQ